MISFIARLLRLVHLFVGISAPPPGTGDKALVIMWLVVFLVVIAWSAVLLYLMLRVF